MVGSLDNRLNRRFFFVFSGFQCKMLPINWFILYWFNMLKKVTNQNRFSRECSAPGTIVDYMKTFIQVEFSQHSFKWTNLIHLCEAIIQFACLFDGVARRYSFHMYGVVVGIWNWNEFLFENDYKNYSTPIIRYRFCIMKIKKNCTGLRCSCFCFVFLGFF